MKPLLLLGCLLLSAATLRAQLSFLPYAGFEQSRTSLAYGDLSSTSINGNLKAGLRADYRLKGGHSPFVGIGTSPAPVQFSFDNAGSLLNATRQGGLQLRLEGGYQYNSKPIQFGKGKSASRQAATETPAVNTYQKRSCGSIAYRSHCGAKNSASKAAPVNQALNMRLQPSLAVAYIPANTTPVKGTADGFAYTANTWKTALVPAMGFEFAKGRQRLFTLGVFYTKPLAQKSEMLNTVKEGKFTPTSLQPKTSTWGFTLGVPFGFAKTKTVKSATQKRSCSKTYRRSCGQWQ